jgi:hypothetical protein
VVPSSASRQHRARHAGGRLWPRAQRGVKGTVAAGGSGNFSPSTDAGYVAYKKPDYSHALSRSDTDLLMLLFETYGGCMERAGGAALPTDAGQGATTWAL